MTEPRPIENIIDRLVPKGIETRKSNLLRGIYLRVRPEIMVLLVAAARNRDLSLQQFVKRAAVAFACYDGDLDYDDVMRGEYPGRHFGSYEDDESTRDGQGGGKWKITHLHS